MQYAQMNRIASADTIGNVHAFRQRNSASPLPNEQESYSIPSCMKQLHMYSCTHMRLAVNVWGRMDPGRGKCKYNPAPS